MFNNACCFVFAAWKKVSRCQIVSTINRIYQLLTRNLRHQYRLVKTRYCWYVLFTLMAPNPISVFYHQIIFYRPLCRYLKKMTMFGRSVTPILHTPRLLEQNPAQKSPSQNLSTNLPKRAALRTLHRKPN